MSLSGILTFTPWNRVMIRFVLKAIIIALSFFLLPACTKHPGSKTGKESSTASGPELLDKYACMTCHSLDGKEMYGPTFRGLHGKDVKVLRRGVVLSLEVDRKYLKRSITDPAYEKVEGFENRIMPVPDISKEDVKLLVDYLIALDDKPD